MKNRPAVALGRLPGFGNWLLCGVSTQLRQEIAGFDDLNPPGACRLSDSGLKAPSLIRLEFLGVAPEAKLLGSIGTLDPERNRRLLRRLCDFLANQPAGG